jgi:hypothetical protein
MHFSLLLMSYHILHQFDEQWLADLTQDVERNKGRSFMASADGEHRTVRRTHLSVRENHRWAVIAVAILIATFALLFALDANHRAETLQQRLDAIETTLKGK